ncbi:hypothetical protein GCM10011514_53670 [Emticicia aquatilis]|uniref:Uncharacterized protein n=1 Tax=Emticicia aquatilis TaxID=1537369 RepID=A0A917DY76_9BACT|nr:hypothetical protein [Emticicia aquatilis]GGD82849.1 hypothetical protein GCM10011514_53670 [Emticicia aquatilis]
MKDKILNAGTFFQKKDIQGHVKNHVAHVKGKKAASDVFHDDNGEVRRAELFGRNVLEKLLKNIGGKEVGGIRIYYGHAPEDKDGTIKEGGKLRPRLFLVPVDENGKDIEIDASALKDEPNGGGVGGGLPCPQDCNEI